MSQLNIDDFQMNQWMFLFDGYGINLDVNEAVNNEDTMSVSTITSNDKKVPPQTPNNSAMFA